MFEKGDENLNNCPFSSISRPPNPSKGFVWSTSPFQVSTKKCPGTWFLQGSLSCSIKSDFVNSLSICQDMSISGCPPLAFQDLGFSFRNLSGKPETLFPLISAKRKISKVRITFRLWVFKGWEWGGGGGPPPCRYKGRVPLFTLSRPWLY